MIICHLNPETSHLFIFQFPIDLRPTQTWKYGEIVMVLALLRVVLVKATMIR